MRVAIPTYMDRVAPNFLNASEVTIVHLSGRSVTSTQRAETYAYTEQDWLKLLEDYHVKICVCGGIENSLKNEMEQQDIYVINNVAGEVNDVLQNFLAESIQPGFGISYHRPHSEQAVGTRVSPSVPAGARSRTHGERDHYIQCLKCLDKKCLDGQECPHCPLDAVVSPQDQSWDKILDAASDVAAEPDRIMCRVSELVYFCLGMGYTHIGVAFCTELWHEAENMAAVFERFFHVTAVCCQVGGVLRDGKRTAAGPGTHMCNSIGMARMLNDAGTDVNVVIGVNVGCDILLQQESAAPCTTLFVKDRLLANNPVGAVYSRYALESIEQVD